MSWISFEPFLCILALWPLYLYVIMTRSQREGADREGHTGRPEDVRDRGSLRRPIRFTPIHDWIPIWHCLLDTLRSQVDCDEMSLDGHLFIVFLASHAYLWFVRCYGYYGWDLGYGNTFCDSPCLLEDCLHIWELMIRLWRRRADPFSPIFGSETGDCVLSTILWAHVMGDEQLWQVQDCSDGNSSRGVVEEAILVMGIDCKPCWWNATLDEGAHLGRITDLTLWP